MPTGKVQTRAMHNAMARERTSDRPTTLTARSSVSTVPDRPIDVAQQTLQVGKGRGFGQAHIVFYLFC